LSSLKLNNARYHADYEIGFTKVSTRLSRRIGMRKIRFVVIIAVIAAAFPATVWAAPDVVSSFTITPGTAYPGSAVAFAVAYKISTTGFDNVVCLYYDDSAWDGVFTSATATSARGATYTFRAAGASGVECDAPANYGRTRVAEWSALALPIQYRLLGDTVTVQATLPSSGGPAAGSHTFDMIQEEGSVCATTASDCTVTDGGSAALSVAATPANVFVSNDATCGANSPCKTGPTALQDAYATVAAGGTINIVGTYSQGAGNTVNFISKDVTLIGVSNPVLENGAGACSGAMLNITATVSIRNLTIDGSCGSGSRTAGIVVAGGSTSVKNVALRNLTSGNGVQATGGIAVVEGNSFSNNNVALDAGAGTLYAFANNIVTNVALNAATNIKATDNVKCNYWNNYNIAGTGAGQYEQRLGAPVSTYIEGAGALALGRANLAAGTGNRVIVNMGRGTPPFNNGTVLGLGAQTSDFFAFCLSRDGSDLGAVNVTSDPVAAGTNGHRLYQIADTVECSPSTNTACWDLAGTETSSAVSSAGATSADLSPESGYEQEGHYVIGNQVDPTAVAVSHFKASSSIQANGAWLALFAAASVFAMAWLWRRRAQGR
jgi:hypothetical protein